MSGGLILGKEEEGARIHGHIAEQRREAKEAPKKKKKNSLDIHRLLRMRGHTLAGELSG